MKLNSLRDFLAVAERGSLRAAARELGITQPSITRSVQELEKELGVTLFERRAKGIVLTRMGEAFKRRANAVRSELLRAKDELDQLRGEAHGKIRVCLSSVAHLSLLPNALGPFRQRYPDVQIDVIDGQLLGVQQDLLDGVVDCYCGPVNDELPAELSIEKLFDNVRVVVGRKGHPLSGARSLRELAQAEWISTSITRRAAEELEPMFVQHGLPRPKLVMHARSSLTFLMAIVSSDLLTVLPIQWAQAPMFRDVLQRLGGIEAVPAPPICLVRRTSLPLTPAADYFCDVMRRATGHREEAGCLMPPPHRASPIAIFAK